MTDYKLYTSHEKYTPSDKIYFGKYIFRVEFDRQENQPYYNYEKFIDPDVDYRKKTDWRSTVTTIYTSDTNFLNWLLKEFQIVKLSSPQDSHHKEILSSVVDDINLVFRKQPYYGKYYFKLDCWVPWTNRNNIDYGRADEITHFMFDLKESKITHDIMSRRWYYGASAPNSVFNYYPSFPKVYTNDEPSLMLFKLMFSNDLTIKISKVVTL